MPSPRSARAGSRRTLGALVGALVGATAVAGCTIEKTYDADAARDSAAAATAVPDTVTRVDTVVQVDTVRIPDDSLPGLGELDFDSAGALATAPGDSAAAGARGGAGAGAAAGSGAGTATADPEPTTAELAQLQARALRVPVQGVAPGALRDNFTEPRGGGPHGAIDIAAPQGTPVVAADDGHVAKLFTSRAGGLTVYVLGPQERFVHYYAHLDRYRDGLEEGDRVRKGDVLGYVGTTGNARGVPHLHFAVARVSDPKRWWSGRPVNPYPLLAGAAGASAPTAGADSAVRRGR